ncbi:hypothetical protein PAAG_07662 [Paracoccidioides lutzii Pb01]|uniref:Uncharacterized protein n=1 Tax=Paracoccidioides lutzii (strain ATCC MYA-826 / Pb01) TaxID=502779 RepID=C1HAK8_PARBA|nr:hypothetical protein PAAG_07662 [Paracoccidioides lutzii Pb01]EEH37381.2 hypothetical protein PAAG_07662 [Paracoccidioides lutzii Pb01]
MLSAKDIRNLGYNHYLDPGKVQLMSSRYRFYALVTCLAVAHWVILKDRQFGSPLMEYTVVDAIMRRHPRFPHIIHWSAWRINHKVSLPSACRPPPPFAAESLKSINDSLTNPSRQNCPQNRLYTPKPGFMGAAHRIASLFKHPSQKDRLARPSHSGFQGCRRPSTSRRGDSDERQLGSSKGGELSALF